MAVVRLSCVFGVLMLAWVCIFMVLVDCIAVSYCGYVLYWWQSIGSYHYESFCYFLGLRVQHYIIVILMIRRLGSRLRALSGDRSQMLWVFRRFDECLDLYYCRR